MCLTTVTERRTKPLGHVRRGWKVVTFGHSRPSARPHFEHRVMGDAPSSKIPVNKWVRAEERTIGESGHLYTSGFHAYTTKAEALTRCPPLYDGGRYGYYGVVPVKLRGVHTVGTQSYGDHTFDVVVAKRMYLEWPCKVHKPKPPK